MTITDCIAPKIEALESRKVTLTRYAESMLIAGDHHAVQDACSDLRDLEAKLEILKLILGEMDG